MKQLAVILVYFLGLNMVQAQEEEQVVVKDTTKTWTSKGNVSVLINQSNFSNWAAGGENNLSGNAGINYDLNYKKDNVTWDNKLIVSYGLVKTKNSPFEKKTDDRLEINSLYGKKAVGYWYYSAFLNFRTQMTKGYVYEKDINGAEIRTQTTNILSPGYLTFGPGILWKKDNNLNFNLAPVTSKLTFVDPNFTLPNEEYFGVKEGESVRYELGFYASGYYKFGLMANVTMENILSLYSNYLEETKNVDVNYQLNVVMKVNRYISTNLSFQAIYDDNAFRGFQTRQVFGVGINFGF